MTYEFREGYSSEWIDALLELHNKTDMKRPEAMKKVVDRMISDGGMYSSIFDVVVDPDHQRKGLGREVVDRLVKSAPRVLTFSTRHNSRPLAPSAVCQPPG